MPDTKEENGDDSGTPEYRDRLRTWLIKMIDSGTITGLQWENDEKTIFRMPWKHAGRQDYSLEEDSKIFMAWAIHSGRYREGIDKPEPIIWKTRLRCALNKMPDIREIPEKSRLDISEPYRVYRFLPPIHKDTQIRRRLQRRQSQAHCPNSIIFSPGQDTSAPPHTYNKTQTRKPNVGLSLSRVQSGPTATRFEDRIAEVMPQIRSNEMTNAREDIRNFPPWIRNSNGIVGGDNALLHGLNLPQCFGTPMSLSNLVSPHYMLAAQQRELRHRSEYDFPLPTYPVQGSRPYVYDHQGLPGLFMPPNPIGGFPVQRNAITAPSLAAISFSRQLSTAALAASEQRRREKMGKSFLEAENERYRAEDMQREGKMRRKSNNDIKAKESDRHVDEKPLRHNRKDAEIRISPEPQRQTERLDKDLTAVHAEQNTSDSEDLSEAKNRIQTLEQELAKVRKAHKEEKERRENLEINHEQLKKTLEKMSSNLLSLIMLNSSKTEEKQNGEETPLSQSILDNTSSQANRRHSAEDLRKFQDISDRELSVEGQDSKSDRVMAEMVPPHFREEEPFVMRNLSTPENRKRNLNSGGESSDFHPLDLTSRSVPKRTKIDGEFSRDESFEAEVSSQSFKGAKRAEKAAEMQLEDTEPSIKKSKMDTVSFSSAKSENDVSPCYGDADVFSMPSLKGRSLSYTASTLFQPSVESPSAQSSCSSSEDSHFGSSISPAISRVSPIMPLFRATNADPYPGYQSRSDGPIQVT